MSELHDKQVKLARLVPRLIDKAFDLGYEVRIEDVKRDQIAANANAASGAGIAHSLHILSLAIDLSLFKDGNYLSDSGSYAELGAFWKQLDPDCCWGGDFHDRVDADHFSITYQGVK